VHVIVLAIALFQGAAKVGTNRLESLSQALPHSFGGDGVLAVLRDEDQMVRKRENNTSSSTQFF
jgi:hypothetical protein